MNSDIKDAVGYAEMSKPKKEHSKKALAGALKGLMVSAVLETCRQLNNKMAELSKEGVQRKACGHLDMKNEGNSDIMERISDVCDEGIAKILDSIENYNKMAKDL